jgi:hypothetical protein
MGECMEIKQYTIDGKLASASNIIKLASEIDEEFADSFIKQTSVAANILRGHGYKIGYAKDKN